MPKPLPLSDLRARRRHLVNAEFALTEGPEYKPSGHINRDVWDHLVGLSDDVLLRTTDDFAGALEVIDAIGWSWLEINGRFSDTSPLYDQTLSALESFQGSAFNAATGWYRIAGTVLRCALEDVLLGLYYETRPGSKVDFVAIVEGKRGSPAIRTICDGIRAHHPSSDRLIIKATRLYAELSVYVHRVANSFIWESNGPVYVPKAFNKWVSQFDQTYRVLCALIDAVVPGTGAKQVASKLRFKKKA